MPLRPGSQLGHIRVEHLLGSGGMSEVYYGVHLLLERPVALKVMREKRRMNQLAKARFMREAKILSQLDHPGICRVHDLILADDEDVLVLEFIEGRSLRQALTEGIGKLEKLVIALQVAEVLEIAHAASIVHRDLKPENVMIRPDGSVKVLDFDLARPVEQPRPEEYVTMSADDAEGDEGVASAATDAEDTQTRLGSIVGTVAYMSPEQARGEVITVAADLYSLGIILHEMMDGQLPYPGKVPIKSRLLQVCEGRTLDVEGADGDLRVLIEELKSLDPEKRPPAPEVVCRLRRIIEVRSGRRSGFRKLFAWLKRNSPSRTSDKKGGQ